MRALMLEPDVVLLDEPLGALDPMIRAELQEDLRAIFRSLKQTVVLVTHDLAEAAWFGDELDPAPRRPRGAARHAPSAHGNPRRPLRHALHSGPANAGPRAGNRIAMTGAPGWVRRSLAAQLSLLVLLFAAYARADNAPVVRVGSKNFTEGVVLGEIVKDVVASTGAAATHRRELGGTRVVWQALLGGAIDITVEYTGTLRQEILAGQATADDASLHAALAAHGVQLSAPLGFNNTFAMGMPAALAERLNVRSVSDLRAHPALRLRFGNEFMDRGDGWPGLRAAYDLPHVDVRNLDHDLAYRGLAAGSVDVMDCYTTDPEIVSYHPRLLVDDRGYFTHYEAVMLWRTDLAARAPQVVTALRRLEGSITESEMGAMNARAKLEHVPESDVAADFVRRTLQVPVAAAADTVWTRLWHHTGEHLLLVVGSLLAAAVVALPLGILAAARPGLGQTVLAVVGILQTLPSLALLVFLIPLVGIGAPPAVFALFVYSLLPMVRNTYTGLRDIPPQTREAAQALGLPPGARLRLVELPLASRTILAGIKTSAVINIGTATLGAVVGAGGYGQPILTGIRLDNFSLVLEGALPAALLALLTQGLFEIAERRLVPKGLRVTRAPRADR